MGGCATEAAAPRVDADANGEVPPDADTDGELAPDADTDTDGTLDGADRDDVAAPPGPDEPSRSRQLVVEHSRSPDAEVTVEVVIDADVVQEETDRGRIIHALGTIAYTAKGGNGLDMYYQSLFVAYPIDLLRPEDVCSRPNTDAGGGEWCMEYVWYPDESFPGSDGDTDVYEIERPTEHWLANDWKYVSDLATTDDVALCFQEYDWSVHDDRDDAIGYLCVDSGNATFELGP